MVSSTERWQICCKKNTSSSSVKLEKKLEESNTHLGNRFAKEMEEKVNWSQVGFPPWDLNS